MLVAECVTKRVHFDLHRYKPSSVAVSQSSSLDYILPDHSRLNEPYKNIFVKKP